MPETISSGNQRNKKLGTDLQPSVEIKESAAKRTKLDALNGAASNEQILGA